MSLDDYNCEYVLPAVGISIYIGGFISAIISLIYTSNNDLFNEALFFILWPALILLTTIISSFIENKPKQALNISGCVLGIIITIASIIFFFVDFVFDWKFLLISVIVLAELYYWIDKKKPRKENKLIFTVKRKGLSFLYVSLAITILLGFCNLAKRVHKFLIEYYPVILKWLGYIGVTIIITAIILGILYGYIWLNSLKYKKK